MAYTAIDNPELYFQVKLYAGNGGTHSPTFDGSEDMQPDLVWLKDRDRADNNALYDSVRGTGEAIYTDSNAAESTHGTGLSSFNSDGWTMGLDSQINRGSPSEDYVCWAWKESVTAGFDIVSYTGNGSTQNISHSLSAKPDLMFLKLRSGTGGWLVYHSSLGATKAIYLDETGAVGTNSSGFNDTEPTSSVFSLGSGAYANTSSGTQICYAWTSKQGFSKFSSFVGNGNADGPFIYTGFKPAFIIFKRTDSTGAWVLKDNKRNTYNVATGYLYANASDAESTSYNVDFTANGVKLRGTDLQFNASGGTFIYMAFAEAPFVNSNGVPCNAR